MSPPEAAGTAVASVRVGVEPVGLHQIARPPSRPDPAVQALGTPLGTALGRVEGSDCADPVADTPGCTTFRGLSGASGAANADGSRARAGSRQVAVATLCGGGGI